MILIFIKNRLKVLSKILFFKNKNHEFSLLLTNNKKMKNLNLNSEKKINYGCFIFPYKN